MSYQRTRRIEEEIRKSISRIILEQVKDPRVNGLVSIIKVELSRDFKFAKTYVSVFGDTAEKENAMEGLVKASGYIRKELGTTLKIRHIPEIQFKLDSSIEYSIKVAEIIRGLSQGNQEANPKQEDKDDSK